MKNPSEYTLAEIESLIRVSIGEYDPYTAKQAIRTLTTFIMAEQASAYRYQVNKELKEITTRQNEPTRRQQNRGDVEAQAECVWIPFEENS